MKHSFEEIKEKFLNNDLNINLSFKEWYIYTINVDRNRYLSYNTYVKEMRVVERNCGCEICEKPICGWIRINGEYYKVCFRKKCREMIWLKHI